MKKQLFILFLLGIIFMILMGLFTLKYLRGEKRIDETRTVFIKKTDNGFQLIRNGSPFSIKGAGGNTHLKELAEIGANTVRVYDTINIQHILDEAHKNKLAVVVDIPLPKYTKQYNSYLNTDENNILKQKIKVLVNKYKNHPALLMWNLGNEVRYPIILYKRRLINFFKKSYFSQEINFIKIYNELIDIMHLEDPNHPVCTTIIAFDSSKERESIYLNSPEIDLISYNIFAKIKTFKFTSSRISFLFGPKPYYISEWGSDGHWESEKNKWQAPIEPTSSKKAEQIRERYEIITSGKDGACLGNLVFYWGQKQEITHTWFCIIDDQGRKSQTYYELQNCWLNQPKNTYHAPQMRYMLIEKKGARDNLVFKPNEIKKAQVFIDGEKDSKLTFNWEIYEEGWVYYGANAKQKLTKKISGCIENPEDSVVTFRVPAKEGPYRIFAYIYDQNGYFATSNTPFYVLNNK
ncbi:MAG: glycoside hydrolase family 2 TIM barrel-domain containing protein [Bacteroidota bacterium]|nr:hypothetical protein [Odoribacter sp.]MDP3643131.1 glycoside hydrolase family 2 TIM barrel-domain containing protein [Bacteroidota bacterium]